MPPLIADEKLNPQYIKVRDDECRSPAKGIIREIGYSFFDRDGNFFKEFQTSGFEPRLWELYLYAYLHEEHFNINRKHSSPDYLCEKYGKKLAIEAVSIKISEKDFEIDFENEDLSENEIKKLNEYYNNYIPIRFGRALKKKLSKRYWGKLHVAGKPFILAIHGYYDPGINTFSIGNYLYGIDVYWQKDSYGKLTIFSKKLDQHQYNGKIRRSGFFLSENTKNISAVLFSNSATISKFNRMGKLAGFGSSKVNMILIGQRMSFDPNAVVGIPFSVEVNPNIYTETWGQGLSMFHNPKAIHPVNPSLFPDIDHHFFKDGQVESHIANSFSLLFSQTFIFLNK